MSDRELFFVLIPCHNDCNKALIVKTELSVMTDAEIIIGHNGCTSGVIAAPWSNKAKTINFYSKYRTEKYVMVVDADVCIESDLVYAFKPRMQRGVRYGCAMMLHKFSYTQTQRIDDEAVFSGAAWFCDRELLVKVGVPEDIVTEDTAFVGMLRKYHKVKPICIHGAVISVKVDEPTFSKQFRQSVRYQLGSYQLVAKRLWWGGLSSYFIMSLNLLALVAMFFSPLAILVGYAFLALITLQPYKKNKKLRFARAGFIAFLDFTIIPFIAYVQFLRRKWVW